MSTGDQARARTRRPSFQRRSEIFIGGEWVAPSAETWTDVVDPFTEESVGAAPATAPIDVDRAVAAAAAALPGWAELTVAQRCQHLEAIAAGLEQRRDELATLISMEVGTPIRHSYPVQADLPVRDIRGTIEAAREFPFEEQIGTSTVLREPVGVVGAITPWNFPLHQVAAKLAGAVAAGCTVVLKPSEMAPLSAFVLMEVCQEAGLPGGVINLVSGEGLVVGEALVSHPGVDMVTFTGSTRSGRRVAELAAAGLKKTALELGGKSAAIILDDADLASSLRGCLGSGLLNSGQTCNAHTRLLVPACRLSEAEEIAIQLAQRFSCGDPLDEATRLGPLISAAQRERVRGFIVGARAEGARLIAGGEQAPAEHPTGYFVCATLFSDVAPSMRIAQEEIFGPVLAILAYDDAEEAIQIANDSLYGLSAGIWSSDQERAQILARRLRAGQVDINGAPFNPLAPFGGMRQSGYGRELGKFGIEEHTACKAIQI